MGRRAAHTRRPPGAGRAADAAGVVRRPGRLRHDQDLAQPWTPAEPDLAGARDRALLLIGFVAALRRSELAALTVDQVAEHPNGLSPGRQLNACVAGRRSIAVTDGALQTFLAG